LRAVSCCRPDNRVSDGVQGWLVPGEARPFVGLNPGLVRPHVWPLQRGPPAHDDIAGEQAFVVSPLPLAGKGIDGFRLDVVLKGRRQGRLASQVWGR
jgi:hypothetical protein